MRQKVVAGNWKMNKNKLEAIDLFAKITQHTAEVDDVKLIVCPPALYLDALNQVSHENTVSIGAQNCYYESQGAFTGEISASMLPGVGAEYCIVGHSERRLLFSESDEAVFKKFNALLNSGIIPILCCGERLEERSNGDHKEVIEDQIRAVIHKQLDTGDKNFIVAYEPVWAIGTGKTASPDQAQEMHKHIRDVLKSIIGGVADDVSILYGGSCKPNNAKELFSQPDIDGGLIGGASLKSDSFIEIAKSFG